MSFTAHCSYTAYVYQSHDEGKVKSKVKVKAKATTLSKCFSARSIASMQHHTEHRYISTNVTAFSSSMFHHSSPASKYVPSPKILSPIVPPGILHQSSHTLSYHTMAWMVLSRVTWTRLFASAFCPDSDRTCLYSFDRSRVDRFVSSSRREPCTVLCVTDSRTCAVYSHYNDPFPHRPIPNIK